MAKVFSPSGETEFFQITELQKAFEKELKTGEKVSIVPGAKEASFLREAPIRADLTQVFEEFKDRVLNPVAPPQVPAFRYDCPLPDPSSFTDTPAISVGQAKAPYDSGGNATVTGAYKIKFASTISPYLTPPTASIPNIPYIKDFYPNTPPYPDCSGWLCNDANPPPFGSIVNTAFQVPAFPNYWFCNGFGYRGVPVPTPNATGYTLSDWLTVEMFVENWLPVGGPSSTAKMEVGYASPDWSLRIQWLPTVGFAYQEYKVPSILILNPPYTPAGTWLKLLEVKADLLKAPNVYPNSGGCLFNLTNFRFTNFYP